MAKRAQFYMTFCYTAWRDTSEMALGSLSCHFRVYAMLILMKMGKYDVGVASSSRRFIPSFVKIGTLFQKLKWTRTHIHSVAISGIYFVSCRKIRKQQVIPKRRYILTNLHSVTS
jgi:hypothetical protein